LSLGSDFSQPLDDLPGSLLGLPSSLTELFLICSDFHHDLDHLPRQLCVLTINPWSQDRRCEQALAKNVPVVAGPSAPVAARAELALVLRPATGPSAGLSHRAALPRAVLE